MFFESKKWGLSLSCKNQTPTERDEEKRRWAIKLERKIKIKNGYLWVAKLMREKDADFFRDLPTLSCLAIFKWTEVAKTTLILFSFYILQHNTPIGREICYCFSFFSSNTWLLYAYTKFFSFPLLSIDTTLIIFSFYILQHDIPVGWEISYCFSFFSL